MALVVVGGHSRNIGKTSVVEGLIRAMPEMHWTAVKITQYGHGFCTADGAPCDCQTDDHTLAISAERPDGDPATDSGRFLRAGAMRSLWVRTRVGMLADAMPRLRREIAEAENVIAESNSVLQFLRPALYLSVLDPATADFKESSRLYLDRADAVLTVSRAVEPRWSGISPRLLAGVPQFAVAPPCYLTDAVIAFVRQRLTAPFAVLQ